MKTELHVVPVDDLVMHEDSIGCVCGPTDEFFVGVYVHHSLDGREGHE